MLRVVVSDVEKAAIEAAATSLGMPVSAYLRALGLGYQPVGTLDQRAIGELGKAIADQARLGNLLRLWLSDEAKLAAFGRERAVAVIREVTDKLAANQEYLYETIDRVNRKALPMRSRLSAA